MRGKVSNALFVLALLLLTGQPTKAQEWICVHGHQGQFQNERQLKPRSMSSDQYRFSCGLEFRMPPMVGDEWRAYDMIHYSLPVGSERTFNKLRVRYKSIRTGFIRWVDINDGEFFVARLYPSCGASLDEDDCDVSIDFGPSSFDHAASISLAASNGLVSGYASLQINNVCLGD